MLHQDRREPALQIPVPNGRRAADCAAADDLPPLQRVTDAGTAHEILTRQALRLQRQATARD
jgi:hypothetical protein